MEAAGDRPAAGEGFLLSAIGSQVIAYMDDATIITSSSRL